MKFTKTSLAIAALSFVFAIAGSAQTSKRAIRFDDMIAMHRVSDPQISPDGKWVAYVVSTPDMQANHQVSDIWLVPASGGAERELTRGGSDSRPRWSPDSRKIAFLSSRDGEQQLYEISLYGGESSRITFLSTGADNQLWSPDGKWLAFVSSVYPDCKDDDCNKSRDEEVAKNPVKAHVAERLLYRHWTAWADGKRSHLFVISVAGPSTPRDLTPGADYDVPPFNLGAPEAIAFSPDSQELCFTANTDKDEALSTNGDLFTVPALGGAAPRRITTNKGDDWGPVYSPDGKWIAFRSQMTPGYESDRWQLMILNRNTGERVDLTSNFDRNVETYAWSPDSRTIYFQAEDRAEMPIFSISPSAGGKPVAVVADGFNAEFSLGADGKELVFSRSSLTYPAELFFANSDGAGVKQITHQNSALVEQLDMPAAEPFWFDGAGGTKVEGLLVKPPHFDTSKKYPMLFLVHGGPQGAWDDDWGYRWNPQVMASPGYVVVMVNPRGSTGYGQKFTDEIQGDWGGKVYEDLMMGVDYALAHYPFIDGTRLAEAGGSYGGYMTDWIATHTGRFRCLISHAGPYDLTSMYGSTEELWFVEHDLDGTPWANSAMYAKWSPSTYAGELGKFRAPTLVIDGELDFRVPYTQDLEFFTALQRQGVPSKLVIFPDEGHWVLKPQNSKFWYQTFLGWLAKYLQ
ncbi:MAG TPA: S9 family peptidase [Candidatus Acidoferrales bacterium]|nr:S9 family peptidase [Candidatus Acidoferrales bacterium]